MTLSRPRRRGDPTGDRLPMPLRWLDAGGAQLYRSELSMVAGQPGAGKSALALHLAIRIGRPCLYIAADTSEQTMRVRSLAMLTGRTQAQCEQEDQESLDVLAGISHIGWCFDASPDMEAIDAECRAFELVHGTMPHLIVIDNAIDVAEPGDSEWSALRSTMKKFKELARDTGAAVLVCHHTSEGAVEKKDARGKVLPPARSAIQGKVSQLAALVLTVHSEKDSGSLTVAVVKNRHGAAMPGGGLSTDLGFDPLTMQITDSAGRF